MNARLPDVALADTPAILLPLDEVGMAGIDLPIQLDERGALMPLHARAAVRVDLPEAQVKGIHMSRLYRLLDAFAAEQAVGPAALRRLLMQLTDSHQDCGSQRAYLGLDFDLMLRRSALVTAALGGWRTYPVHVEAHWHAGDFRVETWVTVAYSSTCPCSAALSRQLIEQAFAEDFQSQATIPIEDVMRWLRDNATTATPHSQRSEARIGVRHAGDAEGFGLSALIDIAEVALATPVQTAVKRADEQAFAALNGRNLMYAEDAARRLAEAVSRKHRAYSVQVTHRESLHAHDAVAAVAQGWNA